MKPIQVQEITRLGGTYRVEFFGDSDAETPRDEYSTEALLILIDGRGDVSLDEVTRRSAAGGGAAGAAATALSLILHRLGLLDANQVERAYRLWQVVTGNRYRLVTGSYQSGNEVREWFAIAVDEDVARIEATAYAVWALGEAFRVDVIAPDGELVDSAGSFYIDAHAMAHSLEAIETYEADQAEQVKAREEEAASAGAGFVGVI